ncbi:NAD(P)H-quinone oxidoreductase [Microbacteriaceae bacterium VKM Ac-2855]|nr:NAD(P)H-quinone oxidoreductase [Microbacteriaceae bacterium VKM Ac-2855]
MRAISVIDPGPSSRLEIVEVPRPTPASEEVLIRVAAAGVNRADLGQRAGTYPPPPGASEVLGMEISGTIEALGAEATGWSVGDEVCALLPGGGYAAYAVVDASLALPVPAGLLESAALPEAAATVWSNLVMVAGLSRGDTLLIHGGGSGIGTMAIQIATALGVRVAVTAGSARKLDACRALGADILIDYHREDFVERMRAETGGADVILDPIGGDYLARDIAALATGGRIVFIGNQSGGRGDLDIGGLMGKRGAVFGTTLRARPLAEKRAIIAAVRDQVWPMIAAGDVRPLVDEVLPLAEAQRAHERMLASDHIGKLLLSVG